MQNIECPMKLELMNLKGNCPEIVVHHDQSDQMAHKSHIYVYIYRFDNAHKKGK